MKKNVRKNKLQKKLEKTLGLFSAIAIAASLFMGYNHLTGNAIISTGSSDIVSIGGAALFILGVLGAFLVSKK